MKNTGLIVGAVVALLLLVVLVRVVIGIVQGAAHFVLGLFVVAALIAIVMWMFAYAKRRR